MNLKLVLCSMGIGLFTLMGCVAQNNYSTRSKKAIQFYEDALVAGNKGKTEEAKSLIRKSFREDTKFAEAYLTLGDIFSQENVIDSAIHYYVLGVNINPKQFGQVYTILGGLYRERGEFALSIEAYQNYLKFARPKEEVAFRVERILEKLESVLPMVQNPVPFNPVNLGPNVNSKYAEYHPAFTVDESMLIYTVMMPAREGSCRTGTNTEEDFFVNFKKDGSWQPRDNLGGPVNSLCNEGAASLSADGRFLFFAASNRQDSYGGMDIYMSERVGESWTTPQNLGPTVNSRDFDSQPAFSADGKTLYFVSTRPGGSGGQDIWVCERNEDGTWTTPINLGTPINTNGDEISPFLHPDGQTLYFASNGRLTIGGHDFFVARKDTKGQFMDPINLGYPINSPGSERSLIVSADGITGYFASDKEGGYGDFDLYKFELYSDIRPIPVTYVSGKVYDMLTNEPLYAKFELTNLTTGKVVVSSNSNKENGKFLVSLPSNESYALTVSAEGYLFYSEHFSLKGMDGVNTPYYLDVPLKNFSEGSVIVLKNVFFDTDKYDLKPASKIELDRLVSLLKRNQKVSIEIGGHTDNQGSAQHNQKLSENRAKSVMDYLISQGIEASRLTFKGYGDTKPVADNATEIGRAQNRRTEFKVTGLK